MRIRFWGTRGSIPAPGPDTIKIGGNTTCLEILNEKSLRIVVDAGTGIRNLGASILKENSPQTIFMLLTHSHWDHLAGFTFFAPAYHPSYSIVVYGNHMAQEVIRRDIYERHDNRYFPVNMDDLRADIAFFDKLPNPLVLEDIKITCLNLNHPGNGFAYCFKSRNKKVVFITDNELGLQYVGGHTPEEIVAFCRKADVLIHDAQFLPEEIEAHRTWGHSTYAEVADVASQAGVRHVLLTHHAPERDDVQCEDLLKATREYITKKKYKLTCELAFEGLSFDI